MNYDPPTKKQKNLSRQGRCSRKPKRKRGSMREVLIKNTYEIIEQLLLRLSCCANSKKSKQIFNGRLKAILLIFQRRRKKIRQKRASTLLAYIPKKNKQRAGGVFSPLRKNARSHDGHFAAHFGKQAAPPRTIGHSLSPSFICLPMGCVGGPCPSSAQTEKR